MQETGLKTLNTRQKTKEEYIFILAQNQYFSIILNCRLGFI